MEKTICELFAGVGGFRLGMERASKEWTTVWANQWEPGKKHNMHLTVIVHTLANQLIMLTKHFRN